MNLSEISGLLNGEHGPFYPDWDGIAGHIDTQIPKANHREAWETAARMWVENASRQLGGLYRVHETENFLILSDAPESQMKGVSAFFEESLKAIIRSLKGAAWEDGLGKRVVFLFSLEQEYYEYIAPLYPDGEHAMSGGLCISMTGYVHLVLPISDYSYYRSAFVHELTHVCLAHLSIPNWLNEAIAMRMEEEVCHSNVFSLDREIYERHLAFWNEESIQTFWSGASWGIAGDSNELSYSLASILWRKIEVDIGATREEVLKFLNSATFEDAGSAAFEACFSFPLEELVEDFLGKGHWAPDPERIPSVSLPPGYA